LGAAVEPDPVVAPLAPRAFRQRQGRARRHRRERLAERRARDVAALHLARDALEPQGPLEPPVTKELGVVGRADEGRSLARAREGVHYQVDEVARLEADLLDGGLRVVDRLGPEVALVVGDPPEPEPPGEVLLVELEVGVVPGVTLLAAPHLHRGPRVAEEGDGLALAPSRGDF